MNDQNNSLTRDRACPHCGGGGKCENGEAGHCCDLCILRLKNVVWLRFYLFQHRDLQINPKGCWCGVCFGRGNIEGVTFKIRNYFPLGFALVFFLLCFWLFSSKTPVPDKLESALTTIMGTIVGFYFGGKKEA
jgi:hypothetical protein